MPGSLVSAAAAAPAPALLDVSAVARLLGCSVRHVYRLADSGRMPAPVRLGWLVRWPRQAIERWIDAGCPPCQQEGGDHAG
jgi:excisionase family DNA binding protein